ncbi:MAG: beta-lactamase family protein [Bacteroidetes bacterium]|nr:beta-lactamase family protein [Bacteroidota bacterium]
MSVLQGCTTGVDEAAVDSLFSAYDGEVPGASLLVMRGESVVLMKSWGMAVVEDGIRATPETNYRLASVTKQFTAASILKLVQNNRLSLEDSLTGLFAGFPSYGNSITVEHLLTHTSGLIDYEDVMPDTTTIPVRDRDVLRLLAKEDSTYFEPGSQFKYSNSAYALLALIVEERSGQSFASFLRDSIFTPLGMSNSVAFEEGISTVPNRAYGYSERNGGFSRTDQSMTSSVLGDGGIYTSISDLIRWYRGLDSGDVIRKGLLDDATRAHENTDNADGGYGFGWFVQDYGDHRNVRHSGSTIGFRNDVERFPDAKLTVVILTNRNTPDVVDLARTVSTLYLPDSRQ